MYYKAIFDPYVDEDLIEITNLEIGFDDIIGNEIIYFGSHEFEIRRDDSERIIEISYFNQCIKTYDIEKVFLALLHNLISDENTVTLYDSDGSSEMLTKQELEYYQSIL